jgi:hypothetical protein
MAGSGNNNGRAGDLVAEQSYGTRNVPAEATSIASNTTLPAKSTLPQHNALH